MNKRHFIHLIAWIGLCLLTGCASSFQAGKLKPVKHYPKMAEKKTIYLDVAFSGKLNGKPWPKNDAYNQGYLKQRCMRELEACGMFSFVSTDLKSTDLRLYVAVINEKETTTPTRQTVSALTLFLIPNTSRDTFRMMAVLKDAKGKEHKIELAGGVNHRQQLLLGLLAPFKGSGNELQKCTDRLVENLCMEIHRSGMLE